MKTAIRLSDLWRAPDRRLLVFAVTAPLAVWVGFIGTSLQQAEQVVRHATYYVLLLAFVLLVAAMVRMRGAWFPPGQAPSRREWIAVLILIGVLSSMAWRSEPWRAKVLNDEFVLQITAYSLHHYRTAATMARAYELEGVFFPLWDYLDKRPCFYPFLVSLLHDATGYRVANAFLVNALLYPVLLAAAWWLARRFGGVRAGLLAPLLLGTLPLLAQNATGAGMEMTNLVMLLLSACLAVLFLEQPADRHRLSAFTLAVVLLCHSRYESALFVGLGGLVILAAWWKQRRVLLAWPVTLAPLLLIPFALQQRILANTPDRWELSEGKSERFSLGYVPDNLLRAGRFFFGEAPSIANSVWLSSVGAVGIAWLLWRLFRHRRLRWSEWTADAQAVTPFAAGVVANLCLVMAYYWAGLDDPVAARFALPFYCLLAVLGAVAIAALDAAGRLTRVAAGGTVVFMLAVSIPQMGRHAYSNLGSREHEWLVRMVQARPPAKRIVIASRSSMVWLLHRIPSILISRAIFMQDRLHYQFAKGDFDEILVTQELRPASKDGFHEVVPDDRLPGAFHLELVAEKRFGTKLLRLSRLVAVDAPTIQREAGGR
ncbi:MAG: hypothetical protein ACOZE5_18370 [Verrucomicrobiota bacterium]